jgi:hypothetical protein
MKVIKPVTFDETKLISSNATELYSAYNAGTTYAKDAIVDYGTHYYISLVNSNTGNTPDISPTFWLLQGPDNKHAMFDSIVNSSTTATTSLTVVIKPSAIIDSIALINVVADVVTVSITDGLGGPVVYSNTAGLSGATISSWYDYFFIDPLLKRTQIIFGNIPPYLDAYITLTFTVSTGSPISVSTCILGSLFALGETQYGTTSGIIDYSKKETDEFGNISFIERPYSKRLSAEIVVPNSQINRVQNLLYSVRAKPAVWIATDDPTYEEPLILFGFYREFSTTISYPSFALMNLDLEGLT